MSNKDDYVLDDELAKSIERLVKEETNVAKAFVDGQESDDNDEKIRFNSIAAEAVVDEERFMTKMIGAKDRESFVKSAEDASDKENLVKAAVAVSTAAKPSDNEMHSGAVADKAKKKTVRGKYIIAACCAGVVLLVMVVAVIVIIVGRSRGYSYNYNKGMEYYNSYNYNAAAEYLEKAYAEPQGKNNTEIMLAIYNCYNVTGRQQEAVDILKKITEVDFGNEQAVKALAKWYHDNKDADGMNYLIDRYKNTDCEKYISQYRVMKPTASRQPGSYEDALDVTLFASSGCTIHYTTDGTVPDKNSAVYSSPVKVDKNMMIKAVAVNEYGIISDVAEFDYKINYKAPAMPVLSVAGDIITEETVIKITNMAADDKAYYTTDGTVPGTESTEYKDGIQLEVGEYQLSVIIINKNNVAGTALNRKITVKKALSYEEATASLIKRMQELNIVAADGVTVVAGGSIEFAYQSRLEISSIEMYYIRMDIKQNDGKKTSEYYGVDVSNGKTYKVSGSGDAMTAVQY